MFTQSSSLYNYSILLSARNGTSYSICVSDRSTTSRVALRRLALLEHRPSARQPSVHRVQFSQFVGSRCDCTRLSVSCVFTLLFTVVNVVFVGVSGVLFVFLESTVAQILSRLSPGRKTLVSKRHFVCKQRLM